MSGHKLTAEHVRPYYHHRTTVYQRLNGFILPDDYSEIERRVLDTHGYDLDRLVHEHIMGYRPQVDTPHYSTDPKYLMAMLIAMKQHGWWARMTTPYMPDHQMQEGDQPLWWCGFTPLGMSGWGNRSDYEVGDITMPLAVSRAGLLTLLVGAVPESDSPPVP